MASFGLVRSFSDSVSRINTFLYSASLFVILFSGYTYSQWRWENPLPHSHIIKHIRAFTPDSLFAISTGVHLMSSINGGRDWSFTFHQSTPYTFPLGTSPHGTSILASEYVLFRSEISQMNLEQITYLANEIYYISYAGSGSWYAGGVSGYFIKSTDDGLTWAQIPVPVSSSIQNIAFSDSVTGIFTSNGYIYRTTDGAQTWSIDSVSGYTSFSYAKFMNSSLGFISGKKNSGIFFLRTTDAGLRWSPVQTGINSIPKFIYGKSNSIIYAGSENGHLLMSSDAGLTWQQIFSAGNYSLYCMDFASPSIGFLAGASGLVFKTIDGGISWQLLSRGFVASNLQYVSTPDSLTTYTGGYKYQEVNKFYRTFDGGNTWDGVVVDSGVWIGSMAFFDKFTGLVTIGSNRIYRTTNSGNSWLKSTLDSSGYYTIAACTISTNKAAILIKKTFGNNLLMLTSDQGLTWTYKALPVGDLHLTDVYFASETRGVVVGHNGKIFLTTDGGDTWSARNGIDNPYLESVHFTDSLYGLAVGLLGDIRKTSDGGLTWKIQTLAGPPYPQPFNLLSVVYLDTLRAVAGSVNGRLQYTTDGGNTWHPEYNGTTGPIYEMSMAPGGKVTYVGSSGMVRSKNFGTNSVTNILPDFNSSDISSGYNLDQNYPNPFNPLTTIRFSVPYESFVTISIFDMLGREIKTLMSSPKPAGEFTIQWNGHDNTGSQVSSGTYIYRIKAGNFVQSRKMLYLK